MYFASGNEETKSHSRPAAGGEATDRMVRICSIEKGILHTFGINILEIYYNKIHKKYIKLYDNWSLLNQFVQFNWKNNAKVLLSIYSPPVKDSEQ